MLQNSFVALRSAVAFFNMKHFQVQKKIRVTPSNFHEVFSTYLRPNDRLLRQSSAGAGSTRVLVLNKYQMVKAVYLPVLCTPHPSYVVGSNSALGLPVEEYLSLVKKAQDEQQSVFAALSYPKGISFSVYDTRGIAQMPMVTVSYADVQTDKGIACGIGKHAFMNSGNANRSRAREFITALHEHHGQVGQCSTFYMINRERGSCLMLSDVQRLGRQEGNDDSEEEYVTGLEDKQTPLSPKMVEVFENKERWIALPEQVLQSSPTTPLYSENLPSEQGLQNAISSGVLLLDFTPRKTNEEGSA